VSYYVYENWQAGPHKSVIHSDECGFCNHGAGPAPADTIRGTHSGTAPATPFNKLAPLPPRSRLSSFTESTDAYRDLQSEARRPRTMEGILLGFSL
jgi:hypothetical protein